MEYRPLGRTGMTVSALGLGCVTFGREIDEAASFAVMDQALARGITLFDTAEAYGAGASETVVGRWLQARGTRDRIVLATKVSGHLTAERILTSAEASLHRLQVEQVDLFQLHRFDPDVPFNEMLEALNQVVVRGWAKAIGCSNFAGWQLAKALWQQDVHGWARMESVQPNYNLVERDIELELLPLCADQEVGVVTYSPLGAGFLTGKYFPDAAPSAETRFGRLPGHQSIYFKPMGWRVLENLRAQSAATGIAMHHLALGWVLRQPGITSVLVGARTPAHLEQAFTAQTMQLEPELLAALAAR